MHFIIKYIKGAKKTPAQYPYVILVQDGWDDFGYKTMFYAELHLSLNEIHHLGNVKILKKGQLKGFTEMPGDKFEKLGKNYCSIGVSLDYYENLFKQGANIYKPHLRGLSDVTYNDDIKAKFEDTEGFQVSLLRSGGAERTIADARKLFKKLTSPGNRRNVGFKFNFKTSVGRSSNSFTVGFDFQRRRSLPHRINILIGYNGTGKTTLLANLAIVASGYGYTDKEDIISQSAGRFIGNQPPFKTVVVVSYSAFDTFAIPGLTGIEKNRIKKDGSIFGYVYCGLRMRIDEMDSENEYYYVLKRPAEIEMDFLKALQWVYKVDRSEALLEILKPLLHDASFQRIGLTQLYNGIGRDNDDIVNVFRGLSSGHKAIVKIITELTAYIDGREPTLVLIDEPETHLHPPLLAAFLKSVRLCLDRFDGYAVIATHSPVVLQETPSRFIRVVRRIVDQTQVDPLSLETFGENVSVISQEVFGLDDGSTDWHDTLRKLAKRSGLMEIEAMFGRSLGFAARSQVLSIRDEAEE